MVNLFWLSSLLTQNADAIGGQGPAKTQALGQNRREFMFDSLMDVPTEPIDKERPRRRPIGRTAMEGAKLSNFTSNWAQSLQLAASAASGFVLIRSLDKLHHAKLRAKELVSG